MTLEDIEMKETSPDTRWSDTSDLEEYLNMNGKDGCEETRLSDASHDEGHQSGEDANKETADSDDVGLKPPDGGYGWFIVLGCFIAHIVLGGLDRSEGVFYLLLLNKFGLSAQLTSWPGAIPSTVQLVLGPIVNAVAHRYSARTSVLVGAAFMTAGMTLNAFAPNFYFLFFSHSLLVGVGRAFAYAPGLILVGMYFNKRAGLATGLGTSGVGLGTFVIVPLAQYLSENVGFSGTFLIMGGFTANMFVAGMLYRPLSMYHKLKKSRGKRCKETGSSAEAVKFQISNETGADASIINSSENVKLNDVINDIYLETGSVTHSYSEPYVQEKSTQRSNAKKDNCLVSSLKQCFPIEHKKRKETTKKKLFNFELLKNPSFLMYCCSMFLFAMAFRAAFTFMPALVESKGIPQSKAALALSVAGAVDTVGRIGAGFILDHPVIRPYRLALYTLIIFGVAGIAFILPFLNSFPAFCVMCGLYGFMTGAYISQKSVVLVDILDVQYLASSFGLLIGFQGVGNLLGPPLSGALKDGFGTYDGAFFMGAGLLVVSGLLMVLSNVFNVILKRKKGVS